VDEVGPCGASELKELRGKIDARNQSPQWESGAAHTCSRIRGVRPDAEEPARNPVNITRNGDVVHHQEW
jgi:hypothetical protein